MVTSFVVPPAPSTDFIGLGTSAISTLPPFNFLIFYLNAPFLVFLPPFIEDKLA